MYLKVYFQMNSYVKHDLFCFENERHKLTHLCRRLQFFELFHDIHICYLEKFKKQEFEEIFF
jgi:hypothetical protein